MSKFNTLMKSNDAVYLFVHILHFYCKLVFSSEDVLYPLVGELVKGVYILS